MRFDLTPLIKRGYKQFLLAPLLAGTGVAALAGIFFGAEVALGLFRGALLGGLDGGILLLGVRRSLPYVKEPRKGIRKMRRYGFIRFLVISSLIVLLFKQGSDVLFVFVGLLLMHIFFIINLTFIASRLAKDGDAKKGVWQNGK